MLNTVMPLHRCLASVVHYRSAGYLWPPPLNETSIPPPGVSTQL